MYHAHYIGTFCNDKNKKSMRCRWWSCDVFVACFFISIWIFSSSDLYMLSENFEGSLSYAIKLICLLHIFYKKNKFIIKWDFDKNMGLDKAR